MTSGTTLRRIQSFALTILFCLVVVSASIAQPMVLTNGNFTGGLAPWTVDGTASYNPTGGPGGSGAVDFAIGGGSVSQAGLSVNAGTTYFLSFIASYVGPAGFGGLFTASFDAVSIPIMPAGFFTGTSFTQFTGSFVAPATTTMGTFTLNVANVGNSALQIDRVKLGDGTPEIDANAAVVPLVLVIAAYLMLADGRRRMTSAELN